MAQSGETLSAAIARADSRLTVLDDRVDVEDRAEFLWLRAHLLPGYPPHRVVIGTDVLVNDWYVRRKRFFDLHGAQIYLHHFLKTPRAMHSLRVLAKSLSTLPHGKATNREVIAVLAMALFDGRAWIIELPKTSLASRFVRKTSPSAFTPINPRYGTQIDFTFIAALEGNQWLRGYVPMRHGVVLGRSGMTVASGFDLGQWFPQDLKDFAFPQALLQKIMPFAAPNNFKRMKKAQVAAKVAKLGPVPILTAQEADLCDQKVFDQILRTAKIAWNDQKGEDVPEFTDLPAGWQTVWLSRYYQEGPFTEVAEGKAFRKEALAGHWQSAIDHLRAYTDYVDRASREADLLAARLPAALAPPAGKNP